jgi:RNA recognition motif-containing protein
MNIYVGNLSFGVSENNLCQIFEAFGQVSFAIISTIIVKDKYSGQDRGFGFIEMPNWAEAQVAIESLNEKDLLSQKMSVNEEARPRTNRGRSGGRGSHRGRLGYGGRSHH